jgi:hypothetical protein
MLTHTLISKSSLSLIILFCYGHPKAYVAKGIRCIRNPHWGVVPPELIHANKCVDSSGDDDKISAWNHFVVVIIPVIINPVRQTQQVIKTRVS